eukprot:594143-Amphidinium_carterae.1
MSVSIFAGHLLLPETMYFWSSAPAALLVMPPWPFASPPGGVIELERHQRSSKLSAGTHSWPGAAGNGISGRLLATFVAVCVSPLGCPCT